MVSVQKNRYGFPAEFAIGDRVYYATPDSDSGIVLDITYSVRSGRVQYLVTFGRQSSDEVWCDSTELSVDKVF